jgi:hypothetical protein
MSDFISYEQEMSPEKRRPRIAELVESLPGTTLLREYNRDRRKQINDTLTLCSIDKYCR